MEESLRPEDAGKIRISSIDIARAIAMFLAVLGHVLTDGSVRQAIYSFHVPLFFMVSGMTLRFRNNMTARSWTNLLIRKLCAYYVPYLIWALINIKHSLKLKYILGILFGTHESLSRVDSQTALWYLPALFTAGILAEIAMAVTAKSKYKQAVGAVFCVLYLTAGIAIPHLQPHGYPLAIDIALIGAGFMILGYAARQAVAAAQNADAWKKAAAAVVAAGLFSVLFITLPRAELIYFCEKQLGNPFAFVLLALTGSLMMLAIAVLADLVPALRKPLAFAGRYTLIVLAIHKPMKRALLSMVGKVTVGDQDFLLALGVAAVTFVAATMISWGISKIAPALAGKGPVPQIPENKEKAV